MSDWKTDIRSLALNRAVDLCQTNLANGGARITTSQVLGFAAAFEQFLLEGGQAKTDSE